MTDPIETTVLDGGRAFPVDAVEPGLSYVDYMAGQALVAFGAQFVLNAATQAMKVGGHGPNDEALARYCYRLARAMLAARTEAGAS